MGANKKINIGVIGVGYLGSYHVAQYQQLKNINFVGCHDIDKKKLDDIRKKNGVKTFDRLDELLTLCDAVSIVTPTLTHFKIGEQAILSDCHILIEKPITQNIKEADILLTLATKNNKIIQVGHIERFNPAFYTLKTKNIDPLFVESHRIAPFNIRGIDVDVILDLMIHDIDILLALVQSPVKDIRGSGVSVLSETFDTVNARIEFENDCIANLTASRIAQKKIRKFRFFEKNSYTTVDFLNPSIERYVLDNKKPSNQNSLLVMNHKDKYITYDKVTIKPHNALKKELSHFVQCVEESINPIVDGYSGYNALKLAIEIQNYIKNNSKK